MLADLLQRIHDEQRHAGEQFWPPVSTADRAALSVTVRQRTGASIPAALEALLAICDGLDFNGLVLYGCEHARLLAMNEHWQTVTAPEGMLILGDTDTDLLAWHYLSGRGVRLDRVSLDETETFEDVSTMLVAVLSERL